MSRPQELLEEIHGQVWASVGHLWAPNSIFGHGIDHAQRAYELGIRLAQSESADPLAVGAACYLMDAGLSLGSGRRDHIARGLELAQEICPSIPALNEVRELIYAAVMHHEADNPLPADQPPEVLVVRDSDTLDRMGLSGIQMTLTYGTWIQRPLCHLQDPCCVDRKPSLDGFSLDYVRHLYSLADAISTSSGQALILAKLAEQDAFFASFEERWRQSDASLTYHDAFRIVEKTGSIESAGRADEDPV